MIKFNQALHSQPPFGGLRFHNQIKKLSSDFPLVTIITATFNAAAHLPKTIQSIRGLTYKNIEWIIIDGGSTDQTVELIIKNEDVVDYWVSEPDFGIYDAWNKGLEKANGEWIAFLGAGDLYMPEALNKYVEAIQMSLTETNFTSSRVWLVNNVGLVLRELGSRFDWPKFKKYMNIAHVGSLHHKELFNKFGQFDIGYKSSADYDFLMRCGADIKALYLNEVTACMLAGGVSNGYRGIHETYVIQRSFGAGIFAKTRYLIAFVKRFVRPLFRGY